MCISVNTKYTYIYYNIIRDSFQTRTHRLLALISAIFCLRSGLLSRLEVRSLDLDLCDLVLEDDRLRLLLLLLLLLLD